MGAWGYKPIENHGALNELGRLFEECQLVDHVNESLQQDLHDNADEIRATAYLVHVLARHGLWQDGRLADITALAISRLRIILDEEVYENVNFHGETIHLLNQLEIAALYVEPGSPWENGYAESFHSRLRDEFLALEEFESLAAARQLTTAWKTDYNHHRPHSSLGYVAPAEFTARCCSSVRLRPHYRTAAE